MILTRASFRLTGVSFLCRSFPRRFLLTAEEQDSTSNIFDMMSVSGSVEVREGDSLAFDLDFVDGCVKAIDNGIWGVLSMVHLPPDSAWSSGSVAVQTTHIEGSRSGLVRFEEHGSTDDPVQIENDVVRFNHRGNAVFDLHLAVDNQCTDYLILEAKSQRLVVSRELSQPLTDRVFDGISVSGVVSTMPGDELNFYLSCSSGYIRKISSGYFSVLWLPRS